MFEIYTRNPNIHIKAEKAHLSRRVIENRKTENTITFITEDSDIPIRVGQILEEVCFNDTDKQQRFIFQKMEVKEFNVGVGFVSVVIRNIN